MSFMRPQMTKQRDWFEIDGTHGTCYIECEDAPLLGRVDADDTSEGAVEIRQRASEYYGFGEIWTIERIRGYGVRSSAPGYMDCTDWMVYSSLEEAERAYRDEESACNGEDD